MKKFLFLAFGAFVVLMVYMSNCGGCNDRPLVEKLERAILQRGWFGINAYICTAKLHKEHYINEKTNIGNSHGISSSGSN